MDSVKIKRIYEGLAEQDGYRILIDRLWPRGIKKETAAINVWMKEVAPSTTLRIWFNHDPEKWADFSRQYRAELQKEKAIVDKLIDYVHRYKTVTLLYAAKDIKHNQALVLQRYLQSRLKEQTDVPPKKK